jgi:hypothetical protein
MKSKKGVSLNVSSKQKCKDLIMKQLLILQISLLSIVSSYSQWSNDPTINNPIGATVAYQINPSITTDGSGGAIIVWDDYLSAEYRVYAQRINNAGFIQWPVNGILISNTTYDFSHPQIIPDNVGGAIIVWEDLRSGTNKNIYAQRINSSGVIQWTTNGISICSAIGDQTIPNIISNGSGGAIISWTDNRTGNLNVYAQLVDSFGITQWTTDGVAISAATGNQSKISSVSDNNGGTIFIWEDGRNGTNNDIYSQRINSAGIVQWTPDGIPICVATGYQYSPKIVSDNIGGAIATWQDDRGSSQDIYVQRVNASGVNQWTSDGVVICSEGDIQVNPSIATDETGGAILSWEDSRNGASDIYAQKINSIGTIQWATNGIAICNATNIQLYPQMIPDGSGGAIITWQDYRNANFDVYAQRINDIGNIQWGIDGVAVSIASGEQYSPQIISDNNNGAIMTWKDVRADGDIYAQKINLNGIISVETETNNLAGLQMFPNPVQDIIRISSVTEGGQMLYLTTVQGEIVLTKEIFFNPGIPEFIDIGHLTPGIYFLRIENITKKIIKI